MKKNLILLLLLFLSFFIFVAKGVAFIDWERMRSDWERMRRELEKEKEKIKMELEYLKLQKQREEELKRREEELKQLLNSCSPFSEEFGSEIAAEVVQGRYITAFELCRKQEKNVAVCIQKIREIRERWKAKCQGVSGQVLADYYYARAMNAVSKWHDYLWRRAMELKLDAGPYAAAALSGAGKALAQMYPGSDFSYLSGSGKLVVEDGEIHFQGWRFVQLDRREEGGIIMQVFPKKINFVNGRYNIAFYLDPETKSWEVVDVNLPFDAQTEKLLLALGRGVRVLDKEIIYMMNEFLHNTTNGLDLYVLSKALLLKNDLRRIIMENLFEYFAFDNYIAKVLAEAKRQGMQLKEKQGGQQSEKTKKKK